MSNKVWLITGVSTGLGRFLAEAAAQKGYTVVGTVRKQEQIASVDALVPGKTFGYLLDVNKHAQVEQVVEEVAGRFGRIDVLVNNAGYGLFGAVEEVSIEEAREQLETNVFGALAMTQAVLPLMRAHQSGHILQISSQAGIASTPGLGIYNASKYALEGFSEALSREVAPLGIRVTLVEPGPFRTEWAGASMKFSSHRIDAYVPTAGKIRTILSEVNGNQPGDPVKAALAMIQVTESETPPLRLALGKSAVEAIRRKINLLNQDLTAWESVSIGADYTD